MFEATHDGFALFCLSSGKLITYNTQFQALACEMGAGNLHAGLAKLEEHMGAKARCMDQGVMQEKKVHSYTSEVQLVSGQTRLLSARVMPYSSDQVFSSWCWCLPVHSPPCYLPGCR